MTDIIIRDMTIDDVSECTKIVQENWGAEIVATAKQEMLEMFYSNSKWPPHYFVAVMDRKVVGFAGLKSAWLMSNAFELIWINVAKSAQGKSIGTYLTNARLQEIRRRGGTMVLLMTQKPKFFERFGFWDVENLNDWVLMVKILGLVDLGPDNSSG